MEKGHFVIIFNGCVRISYHVKEVTYRSFFDIWSDFHLSPIRKSDFINKLVFELCKIFSFSVEYVVILEHGGFVKHTIPVFVSLLDGLFNKIWGHCEFVNNLCILSHETFDQISCLSLYFERHLYQSLQLLRIRQVPQLVLQELPHRLENFQL